MLCRLRIKSNKGIDVVEGVEQEMRIQLIFQAFQFGFNPAFFQFLPFRLHFIPVPGHPYGNAQPGRQSHQHKITGDNHDLGRTRMS